MKPWQQWVVGVLAFALFIFGIVLFANYMDGRQDAKDERFLQECAEKGGTPVNFENDRYLPACVIDGQKFYR